MSHLIAIHTTCACEAAHSGRRRLQCPCTSSHNRCTFSLTDGPPPLVLLCAAARLRGHGGCRPVRPAGAERHLAAGVQRAGGLPAVQRGRQPAVSGRSWAEGVEVAESRGMHALGGCAWCEQRQKGRSWIPPVQQYCTPMKCAICLFRFAVVLAECLHAGRAPVAAAAAPAAAPVTTTDKHCCCCAGMWMTWGCWWHSEATMASTTTLSVCTSCRCRKTAVNSQRQQVPPLQQPQARPQPRPKQQQQEQPPSPPPQKQQQERRSLVARRKSMGAPPSSNQQHQGCLRAVPRR